MSEERITNYWQKRRQNPVYKRKQFILKLKEKYKGFKFEYSDINTGGVFIIEVKNPFRIMMDKYKLNLCDDKEYNHIQNELRKRINAINPSKSIIIVDPSYTQVHLTNTDNVEAICDVIKDFIKENIEKYGQYEKNGKKMGAAFVE